MSKLTLKSKRGEERGGDIWGIKTPIKKLLDTKTQDYVKEALPFFIAIIILVVLLMIFPSIVLFIPNLIYGL